MLQAMHQNGNKAEAFAVLAKLARRHPGSHAVALTHMRLLRADDPQAAALLAQQFLASAGEVLQGQASAVRAATLAEAAICYVAVGALADAVDALTEAIGMAAQLGRVAEERRAAAKATDAARRAAAEAAADTATHADAALIPPAQDRAPAAAMAEPAAAEEPAAAAVLAADAAAPQPAVGTPAEFDIAHSDELDLWRRAAAPTTLAGTALGMPKLHVACAVGAAKEESGWLANHVTAAQISLAGALVIHDAGMARQMAVDAVTSGKLQPQAHDAAAQACVAMRDFGEAVRHVTAGLKVVANHTGLLRTFARLLREQGKTQDAVLVATYARDVAIMGPARVSGSVREAFFGIRESVLGI